MNMIIPLCIRQIIVHNSRMLCCNQLVTISYIGTAALMVHCTTTRAGRWRTATHQSKIKMAVSQSNPTPHQWHSFSSCHNSIISAFELGRYRMITIARADRALCIAQWLISFVFLIFICELPLVHLVHCESGKHHQQHS